MGTLYAIRAWDRFLGDKAGGRRGRLQWLKLPVKPDDLDYIALMERNKDGAACFGVWVALLEVAGTLEARDGKLCRSSGVPFSVHELSQLTRIPEVTVERALSALSDIGWLVSEPFGSVPNDSETLRLEESRGRVEGEGEDLDVPTERLSADADDVGRFVSIWNESVAGTPVPAMRPGRRPSDARCRKIRGWLKEAKRFAGGDPWAATAASMRWYAQRGLSSQNGQIYGVDTFLRATHREKYLEAPGQPVQPGVRYSQGSDFSDWEPPTKGSPE